MDAEEVVGEEASLIATTIVRKKRSAEIVAEEKMRRDAKRFAREKERKEKQEDTRRKLAEKAVRQQLAKRVKVEKIPIFTWTTGATEDLVQLVAQLKYEHDTVLEGNHGFVSWTKFFKENAGRKEAFETLKDVSFEALERRYKAICTTYKAVRDVCAETGGGCLLDQLSKYNMSQSVYGAIWALHKDNDAMNAVGGADITDIHYVSNDAMNAPQSPYMYDNIAPFHLGFSDSEVGDVTSISQSYKLGTRKPPALDNNIARKKGNNKLTGVDEGLAALMTMQVESQERMEKWSEKMEAQREKAREEREARRVELEARLEKERQEHRKDRAQERQNNQMMNVMMITMLAKISGVDVPQFDKQSK